MLPCFAISWSLLKLVHWSHWCHPTISSSVASFSSCPQSFPASGCFPMSWLFASAGQSIGNSASASVLPTNIERWFPFGLPVSFSWCPRDFQESSLASEFEIISSLALSLFYGPLLTLVHNYCKNNSVDYANFCWQSYVFAFLNMLSRFVIVFLPRSKHILISCLQSPSTEILEPNKIKSVLLWS